jgi:hypothetical protein
MIEVPKSELISVDKLITDETNPNKMSKGSYNSLKEVIKQYGFIVPIITNKRFLIADGYHRLKAAIELGMNEVPVIALDVEEVDRRLLRQVMNKLRGEHDWDLDALDIKWLDENNGLSELLAYLPDYSKDIKELLGTKDNNPYSQKIEPPTYLPNNKKPEITELYDKSKYNELIDKIEASELSLQQKEFLKLCASRHIVFNYDKIADLYAHSEKPMQEQMESSALVIIDFDKAIAEGFVRLSEDIAKEYLNQRK